MGLLIEKGNNDACERCMEKCKRISEPIFVSGRPKYCCQCSNSSTPCITCVYRINQNSI
jgi:hypothetical protein